MGALAGSMRTEDLKRKEYNRNFTDKSNLTVMPETISRK